MRRRGSGLTLLTIVLAACASGPTIPDSSAGASEPPTELSPAAPVPSDDEATPLDLSAHPLVWFAPLPPLPTGPGRPYVGSEDFMQLFARGAAWDRAASRLQVFKLYGEWVAYDATDDELRAAIRGISQRGMVLAVEMGPLDSSSACGQGVESFAGIDEGRKISQRIRDAGGTLQVVALDEPYFFAHVYDGPNACRWPVERVAEAVAGFVRLMRADWPALVVGDTEPMPAPVDPDGLAGWLDAYRASAGESLAFLHLDMDWTRSDWPSLALAVQQRGTARDVPIGIIYNGGDATSDAQWVAVAGRRILSYEDDVGGRPDHVLFQSWMDKPDRVLPETVPTTFTSLIDRYFDDRSALAQTPGMPTNLAVGKRASASVSVAGSTPGMAIDGDADTLWSAGTGPPAWIKIDLGSAQRVTDIRLMVSQYPAGQTNHRVACAASLDGRFTVLADLIGATSDLDVLTVKPDSPVPCRVLRIDTVGSPSWVAWREIEVFGSQ